jgi:hypothetical protein
MKNVVLSELVAKWEKDGHFPQCKLGNLLKRVRGGE